MRQQRDELRHPANKHPARNGANLRQPRGPDRIVVRVEQLQHDREALGRGAANASTDTRRAQKLRRGGSSEVVGAHDADGAAARQVLCAEKRERERRRALRRIVCTDDAVLVVAISAGPACSRLHERFESAPAQHSSVRAVIVKDVRGSESICDQDSHKM